MFDNRYEMLIDLLKERVREHERETFKECKHSHDYNSGYYAGLSDAISIVTRQGER